MLFICKDFISVEKFVKMGVIAQIGLLYQERVLLMQTKYGFDIKQESISVSMNRLTNQTWKLIPMREHNEDWAKQLVTVIMEIAGLNEIFGLPQFLQLLSKLEGLKLTDISFELFRKTVFECLTLLQELSHVRL